MAPRDGRPCGSTFIVIATMLPSEPAAYSRTENATYGGGPPGLYVDRAMFCFHVPMIKSSVCDGPWAAKRVDHAISAKPTTKLRLMETSYGKAAERHCRIMPSTSSRFA